MQIHGHDISVCSWSLQPRDAHDLIENVRALETDRVHLALAPFIDQRAEIDALRESGLKLSAAMISFAGEDYASLSSIKKSGGFVPDFWWETRRDLALRAAELALELGTNLLSTHIGFVPPSSAPAYATIVERVGELADKLAPMNVSLLMETGQETANELLQFLNDLHRKNVGVNFDPANMILYGAGDPVDAVRVLGRHIVHVHIKDAVLSDQPRMKWGTEVPFGSGQVRPRRLIDALDSAGFTGAFAIEREAGDDRLGDIRTAIETLRNA